MEVIFNQNDAEYGYGDGFGDGYVFGDGDGYGSGDGFRHGYGYGTGDGYGTRDGFGDGYGDGFGDGYGSGFRSGDGYGYGDGSEDGDGSGYWREVITAFAAKWPEAQQERLSQARAEGATIAFWLSDIHGCACNGGTNRPVRIGTIETTKGTFSLCQEGTLHATLWPPRWRGERWWIVALHGKVVGDEEKLGALKREILGECQ